jgi:phosphoadenosine phosphosulfate reductase
MSFELTANDTPTAEQAIELLRANEPEQGYIGCFSGGKDSVVIKELADKAVVNVTWFYNKTCIDPPELVQFIKREHPDVIWNRPKHGNFFKRVVQKGIMPSRHIRWCCDEYKEKAYPKGSVLIMGIRAEESPRRVKDWDEVTEHRKTANTVVNPIFWWSSDELWNYIHTNDIPYCSLYDEGFSRLGCVGCPMVGKAGKLREFKRWPQYEKKWKRACELVWWRRTDTVQRDGRFWFGSALFDNWEQMWEWWLYDKPLPDNRQEELKWTKTD